MAIALSHGGPTIYETGEPSREVLVGTLRGVTRLVRDGSGWRAAGVCLTDQHISAILVEPEDTAGLAAALVRVLSDRRLAERLGSAAQASSGLWTITPQEFASRLRALVERIAV